MVSQRKMRRTIGLIARYISPSLIRWAEKADGRSRQGRRAKTKTAEPFIKLALVGILAGCKGLKEVEELSEQLSPSARKKLDLPSRIADTTLRDFLAKLDPIALRHLLSVVGYDAGRRKALRHRSDAPCPFGVLSADGKVSATSDTSDCELSQLHHTDGVAQYSLIRTLNSCLITAEGRPLLGSMPIAGDSNEVGTFKKAIAEVARIYGPAFRVVMYDAGGASRDNANFVVEELGKDYIFLIANEDWLILKHMRDDLFKDERPSFVQEEVVSDKRKVIRKIWVRGVRARRKDDIVWEHTKTLIQVENQLWEDGEQKSTYRRYAVSSLETTELSAEQLLRLLILRWGVETMHGVLDNTFDEDDRPWLRTSAQGALAVQMLRRVAYTLMTLFRSVTVRNEDDKLEPWRRHLQWVKTALEWASPETIKDLRPRSFKAPPALA